MKKHLISLLVLFLLLSTSFVGVSYPIASLGSGNHAPIRIIGNDQFTEENGVTDGSGTEEDPYIIEDWVIVSDGTASQGIFINNTDVYFIIRNCTIQGFNHPDEHYHGIQLSVVTNGRVENTIMTECQTGIDIRYSTKNELINCSCSDYPHQNAYGINIIQSTNMTITSCICNGMSIGVRILESSDIILQETECSNNTVWGLVADVLYQDVLHFLIVDCTFNDNAIYGIYLSGSLSTSCSIIRNCSISNNDIGIKLERLSDNIVENCVFNQNTIGLYLDRSNRNSIRNCSFRSHVDEGVLIAGMLFLQISIPRDNEISYCDFIDNYDGIFLLETRSNTIHHCAFINNTYTGVTSLYSFSKIVSNNFIGNGNDSYYIDTAGMYSWSSFLDGRNNWWGSSRGPCVSLLFRQTILPLRTVENSDIVMLRKGFALFRPWLSEPVPDAGKHM
jgi:parallel beta-helix repeat protein